MTKKLSYHSVVNYSQADPMKILAQKEGAKTASNMPFGYQEVEGTRGESAYVFKLGNIWGALVQEGLGTKSLIAQEVYKKTGKSYFASIAQDTVACIINDLVSVGATPVALNAYWSASSYEWLTDKKLAEDFIIGWRKACDEAEVVWGGGETQSLSGMIEKNALEFAGSAFGVIKNEKHLIKGSKLKKNDAVIFIETDGPNANGISLIRQIASSLPEGYQTKINSTQTLAEAVLSPATLYTKLIKMLQKEDIDIHYLSNITGHGWRKIMRAEKQFSYEINTMPKTPEVFNFIAQQSKNSEEEMYGNYNMGAGYALYVSESQVNQVLDIAKKLKLRAFKAGSLKSGPKQVVIKPKNIIFSSESLEVR